MIRIALFLIGSLCFLNRAEARHIAGGEITYSYLGLGTSPNAGSYRITLRLYRDCQSTGAGLDATAAITIYPAGGVSIFRDMQVPISRTDVAQLTSPGPCIDNAPTVCYQIGIYTIDVELPFSTGGYVIAYQRCCRIENISNVFGSSDAGSTYMATIPGQQLLNSAPKNSTPVFQGSDTVLICEDNSFIYDFSAKDPDGDSLVYQFEEAYDFAGRTQPQPLVALPPPYVSVNYGFGFSAAQPMGPNVNLNRFTGIMSGTAPLSGIFVVTVAVYEYRSGILINRHRKDLHIKVASCSIAAADLQPEFVNCQDFTLGFQNKSSSPLIKTYNWDFGLPGVAGDTSTLARPSFTYPDTGTYTIRLITNRNQECSDTAYSVARIYPGFSAGFTVMEGCKNIPLQFSDTTKAKYGTVNQWRWIFGHPQINPDSSRAPNPTYAYPATGAYQVQLIVASSKGCRDTIDKTVNVLDRPPMKLTNDTVMCYLDSMQLEAIGIGTFSWTPVASLNNPTIPNPVARPAVTTKYYVTLTSAPGCTAKDSVLVTVKDRVSLEAGRDTTICLTDSIRLSPQSDALTYSWSPAATIQNPNAKNSWARPTGTTTYTVEARIGSCAATDAFTVSTVPYPSVTIREDTTICFGDSAPLWATGGLEYRWIPATGLNDNNIRTPIARPLQTTVYWVAVRDNAGCPKASFDSVRITVNPQIFAFAGNDTAVVIGQPLQLMASGGDRYHWMPATGLTDPFIPDPVADLNEDITYVLKVTDQAGCFAFDTMKVRVFRTPPDIFVPSAFTPNGDGLNDRLVPIPVGISQLDFFRVYNRYGELVFSTRDIGKGWDGRIGIREQGNDSYAWYVQGKDYTGKTVFKKGTTTLIR